MGEKEKKSSPTKSAAAWGSKEAHPQKRHLQGARRSDLHPESTDELEVRQPDGHGETNEVATDKLDITPENGNDSSTAATIALPTTGAAEDEVFVKKERPAHFKDVEQLANEHDASVYKTQEEELEQSTAAAEEEDGIPEREKQVPELLHQVPPTAQCDLRPTKSDPRHTNGGSAESTNQATSRRKRALRVPNDHSSATRRGRGGQKTRSPNFGW
ncbi:hypothetical protein FQA39_LY15724 [Lamprigera yunnana]|nr:hypothetical protein FQA39_LY15724 [Lamprigera yunnana]